MPKRWISGRSSTELRFSPWSSNSRTYDIADFLRANKRHRPTAVHGEAVAASTVESVTRIHNCQLLADSARPDPSAAQHGNCSIRDEIIGSGQVPTVLAGKNNDAHKAP